MSIHYPSLVPLKDSITTQLLKVVFAWYLVLVVVITLFLLGAEYVHTKTEVRQELETLGTTLQSGLEQALWEMNVSQMQSIMVGSVQLSIVVGVHIEDNYGDSIGQIGQVFNKQGKAIVVNQEGIQARESSAAGLFWHNIPLVYTRGTQEFPVGMVIIYSNSGVVFERIRFGFLLVLFAAVIQVIAFWMLFLWISRTRLSRPLAELTYATGQLDLDNLENINIRVHTSGRNELKILEETFNAMVQKLLEARITLYEYANALNENRQQLQDILNNAPAVIFMKDAEGRYLLINRQYELLFHISKSEIIGKTDYEIFPKDMADVFSHNDQQVITAQCHVEVEEYAPHDDGIHTYLSVKFPLRDATGRMYAVCGIATDISERKEAEEHIRKLNQELEHRVQERTARLSDINALLKESEKRLKEAQHIAQLGNWDWNIQKNELFWSDEIYRIFGLQPQEFGATYEAFLQAVHPKDRDAVQQSINDSLYHGKSYSLDHRIVLPDGTVRVVHEGGEMTFNEEHEPLRMLGTVQDMTERKRLEDDLRHAKEIAETANQAKSVFLANMSHELRTPLHSILGFAQRLKQDATLTAAQHQYVDIIHRNGEHLLTLLTDILDFSKIEADTFELHPSQFALRSLLTQLADVSRLKARQKRLTFIYDVSADVPHVVYGDQKRLRQIILNLLDNAIRFTEQGRVTCKILACSLQLADLEDQKSKIKNLKSKIRFEISDTGIGIASEHLETIFEPFQQANPQRLQEGSRGLGLAISQRFVHTMGSQLHVTSTVGEGSTFWFELELPVIDAPVTDVPYQVQKDALGHPSQETLTTALTALPSDWLATLRQGAEEVDPEALADIIARIRKRDLALARTLVHLTEEFEYDEILNLIQEAKH